jgi:hypothetical protein
MIPPPVYQPVSWMDHEIRMTGRRDGIAITVHNEGPSARSVLRTRTIAAEHPSRQLKYDQLSLSRCRPSTTLLLTMAEET